MLLPLIMTSTPLLCSRNSVVSCTYKEPSYALSLEATMKVCINATAMYSVDVVNPPLKNKRVKSLRRKTVELT